MADYNKSNKFVSVVLIFALIVSLVSCSGIKKEKSSSNKQSEVIEEQFVEEKFADEKKVNENITPEIYCEEILVAEEKVSELLLEEKSIEEVLLCQTVYVSQKNIKEFAKNSQIAGLFGDKVELTALLKKIAIGSGVIITLVVVKKANLPDPVASVVVAAADQSVKSAATGAASGTLLGGLSGAVEELDKQGKVRAVAAFAAATAGLVIAAVSLVGTIPSGGASAVTAGIGVKIAIAGVSVLSGATKSVKTGINAVKKFTSTDADDLDWNNINWNKVGVTAAKKAVKGGSDGYVWGAVSGAVVGGIKGYKEYRKKCTPYTKHKDRLKETPKDSQSGAENKNADNKSDAPYTDYEDRKNQTPAGNNGHWTNERGESDYVLDEPIELPDGRKISKVTYSNAVPDFSPYAEAEVNISEMTNNRPKNFRQADEVLAKIWNEAKHLGKDWTAGDIEDYRHNNNLSWHEMSNMESMQLVPTELNAKFTHSGGVSEYNAMIGLKGGQGFD